jgi:hypothetical protein
MLKNANSVIHTSEELGYTTKWFRNARNVKDENN